MGFHKRYIDNEQVHRLFRKGGASAIIDWYEQGVDAIATKAGLASDIAAIISDSEWRQMGRVYVSDEIDRLVLKDLGQEAPTR